MPLTIPPRLHSHIERGRRTLPAAAFFGGFGWDTITLGRVVKTVDLWILAVYGLAATIILLLLSRQFLAKRRQLLLLALQFLFGGMFSALVVLYFKSSGELYTLLFVLLLAGLLVANEFLVSRYQRHHLSWAIFTLCVTMVLNFLLPHLVHSLHPAWFYLSCAISYGLVLGLRQLAHGEIRQLNLPGGRGQLHYRDHLLAMIGPTLVMLLLLLLHANRLIPPVPLVLKAQAVCHDLHYQQGTYSCQLEKQALWRRFSFAQDKISYEVDEKIYALVAVFAPDDVEVELEQRWLRWSRQEMEWQQQASVALPMKGGRQQGWRTYSYLQKSIRPGKWKVETAVKGGAVLAYKRFILQPTQVANKRQAEPFNL